MQLLVTRFHLLLLTVTLAITGVGFLRIPADFRFPAHWSGSQADWQWPRGALLAAPLVQIVLLVGFLLLGRALTRNHFSKVQHILDPTLSLLMAVVAATQLGFLLTGIGSDLDFIRFTGFALGATLLVLSVVLWEAERHTYAGLRMPWPIPSDHAWRWVHRCSGIAFALGGGALALLAWFDLGAGMMVIGFAFALLLPPAIAALATMTARAR